VVYVVRPIGCGEAGNNIGIGINLRVAVDAPQAVCLAQSVIVRQTMISATLHVDGGQVQADPVLTYDKQEVANVLNDPQINFLCVVRGISLGNSIDVIPDRVVWVGRNQGRVEEGVAEMDVPMLVR